MQIESAGRRDAQATNAWRVTILLTAVNVMNFYDRTVPAILIEPIRDDFDLSDTQVGAISASFIVVYAVAGIWLGRLADTRRRRLIMGWGLLVWSVFTALSAGAWSFLSIVLIRLGVGIGEASFGPAANSIIADLFPATSRSRAVAVLQFGIPIGTILAFLTTGAVMDAFGTWRAPFLVAAVPGVVLALLLFRMDEPRRGSADETAMTDVAGGPVGEGRLNTVRQVLSVPTMRWLIASGVGVQVAAYGLTSFIVPMLQRYYGLSLTAAALNAGVIVGAAALAGLIVGGVVSDRASRRSPSCRVALGGIALLIAVPLAGFAFHLGPTRLAAFVIVVSAVSFLQFFFHTSALPAVSDVNPPHLRASAVAVFFAAFYLFGGAGGPILTGWLSDTFAASGHGVSAEGYGLHRALLVVLPISLLVGAVGLIGAARTVNRDRQRLITR